MPHGTPESAVSALNAAIRKAMDSPEVESKLAQFTYERYTMAPDEMKALMSSESPKWGSLIKSAGLKLD